LNERHELKHEVSKADYMILRDRLKYALTRDEHSGVDGSYVVRSLYFDTPKDSALRDKRNGLEPREKFRVRRYIGSEVIHIEKKSKAHGLYTKSAISISAAELRRLSLGDLRWMMFRRQPLLDELYVKMTDDFLTPKTIVEYHREAFCYKAGNVRITFDSDIRTGLSNTEFLNDGLILVPAQEGLIVMEVKYNQFLPDFITKLIALEGRQAGPLSKYEVSRRFE
jgi:hypothetical protein